MDKEDLRYLREVVLRKTGIDLAFYKETQLQRRLQFMMLRAGTRDAREYAALLEKDPRVLEDFKNRFAINVSEFFRNPERFEDLRTKVLPEIMATSGPVLKIWSAGCSVGSEPYSIAMVLEELERKKLYQIWATDIDEDALQQAKEGVYSEAYFNSVPEGYLEKYVTRRDGNFAVVAHLKRRIVFVKHDLLRDRVDQKFDLVVCRNVVIYFEEEAKKIAFAKMSQALRKGGYLWIGSTERIPDPSSFGLRYTLPFFYRKEQEVNDGSLF
ncbi:MAG: CheR family methyltransferase [Candidatus Caldatribacteriaceae bacterium]